MVLEGTNPVTQLLHYVHNLATSLDAEEQIDNVYLDMEKAFDRVLHEKLLHKLEFLGIRNHLLHWIGLSYLTDRRHRVSIDGISSDWKTCIFWRPTRLDNWSYSVSYLYE